MDLEIHGARSISFVWTFHTAARLLIAPLQLLVFQYRPDRPQPSGPLAFTSGVVGLELCTTTSCFCGAGIKPKNVFLANILSTKLHPQPWGFFLRRLV